MKFKNLILFLFAITIAYPWACEAQGADPLADIFAQEQEFLDVEEAFQFDFSQHGEQLTLSWKIADGYYLYKKQFKTVVKEAEVSEPTFPEARQIEDEFFGISDVFFEQVDVGYIVLQSKQDGVVKIRYQGCAEAGLCYPPTTKVVYLNAVGGGSSAAISQTTSSSGSPAAPVSEQFELADLLASGDNLFVTLMIFVALGAGLAFTPCVFPMYPILSAIVIGQGKSIKTSRAFNLSFAYVQGMAITYSLIGLIVAFVGVKFHAALQDPIVIFVIIGLFVLFALGMFGAYELQMPSSWQEKLNNLSNKQKGGNYGGVVLMGAISALVASPCTTLPLMGILLYIANSGDLLLGGSALYALSMGMGIPLIIFGVTSGKLLPKAGNWMNIVKVTFGIMMLFAALMFLERVIVAEWTNLLWAALGLASFTYYYVMNQNTLPTLWKGVRSFVIFVGLFLSGMYGYQTIYPTHSGPMAEGDTHATQGHPEFLIVKDLEDFEAKLAAANAEGKTVMVDLYADWCVACKEFEKYTFPDADVIKALSNTVWMQIDLTDNTPVNLAFQEHFGVLGLPTILFFDQSGRELDTARVTGFMKAEPFADHVNRIFAAYASQ